MADPVVIGNATLYLGDCLELLPCIGSVDAVITDPPFNAGKDFANDSMPGDEWLAFCGRLSGALADLAATNVVVEVGKSDRAMRSALDARLRYRWALALNYTNAMRNGAVGYSNFGLALWYGEKCFKRFMDRIDAPIENTLREFAHPSPKTTAHYARLIDMFCPSPGTVCDPFLGSGTTGVACADSGRMFIGIEIDPEYFDLACKRIAAAYAQGRLFA